MFDGTKWERESKEFGLGKVMSVSMCVQCTFADDKTHINEMCLSQKLRKKCVCSLNLSMQKTTERVHKQPQCS